MAKVMKNLLLAAALGMAMAAGAQNLDRSAEDRTSTFEAPGKPTRGMSQDAVEASFGSPPVSYTHLTLPTTRQRCRSRGSPAP